MEIGRGGREGAGEKVRGNEGDREGERERGRDWRRKTRKRKMSQEIKGLKSKREDNGLGEVVKGHFRYKEAERKKWG